MAFSLSCLPGVAGCQDATMHFRSAKNIVVLFVKKEFLSYLLHSRNGEVAEWLGRGLQNLVQRFESALRLHNPYVTKPALQRALFVY